MFLTTLKERATTSHKEFSKKLTPDTRYEILGVKVPIIKEQAKEISKDFNTALSYIYSPHEYFEEWFLCGFIICYIKTDFNTRLKLLKEFLPHVDNWAICDSVSMALNIPKDKKQEFFNLIKELLQSDKTYTVRFAIVCLLHGYLGSDYNSQIYPIINSVKTGEYYVDMAISWYYSYALVKDYDNAVKYFEKPTFSKFIHNKSLQKAIESYRVTEEKKKYLKLLKI